MQNTKPWTNQVKTGRICKNSLNRDNLFVSFFPIIRISKETVLRIKTMLWIFVIVHLFIRTVYTFNCFLLVNAIMLVILIPGATKYWKMGLYCKIKKPPKLGLYACQISSRRVSEWKRCTSSSCLFLLRHLPVQVTWWFFASDGSEIQARVKDFRPVHEDFPSNVFLFFIYVNKVFHTYFVVYGSFIFQNINFQLCLLGTKDSKYLKSQITLN